MIRSPGLSPSVALAGISVCPAAASMPAAKSSTATLRASGKFLRALCARARVKPEPDEILFEVIFILLLICGCSTHKERPSPLPPDRAIPDVAQAVRLTIQSPPFVALGQIARCGYSRERKLVRACHR